MPCRQADRGVSGEWLVRRAPRRPRIRAPVPRRQGPRCRIRRLGPDSLATLQGDADLVGVRQEARQGRTPRPAGVDDRVQRRFIANPPNRLWLTDVVEHRTDRRLLDRLSDESRLVTIAIRNAAALRRDAAGCVVHSDRGSQLTRVRRTDSATSATSGQPCHPQANGKLERFNRTLEAERAYPAIYTSDERAQRPTRPGSTTTAFTTAREQHLTEIC